jgi:hypothetical protein
MKHLKTFNDFSSPKASVNEEAEGGMYINDLKTISDLSNELSGIINPDEDLEAWVQDKITLAKHNMEAISDYYKSKQTQN